MTDTQRYEKVVESALLDMETALRSLLREYSRQGKQEELRSLQIRLRQQASCLGFWGSAAKRSLGDISFLGELRRKVTPQQFNLLFRIASLGAEVENSGYSIQSPLIETGLLDYGTGEVTKLGYDFLAFMRVRILPGFTEDHFKFQWAGWKFEVERLPFDRHHRRDGYTTIQEVEEEETGVSHEVAFAIRLAKECCGLPKASSWGGGGIIPEKAFPDAHRHKRDLTGQFFSQAISAWAWARQCTQAGMVHIPGLLPLEVEENALTLAQAGELRTGDLLRTFCKIEKNQSLDGFWGYVFRVRLVPSNGDKGEIPWLERRDGKLITEVRPRQGVYMTLAKRGVSFQEYRTATIPLLVRKMVRVVGKARSKAEAVSPSTGEEE